MSSDFDWLGVLAGIGIVLAMLLVPVAVFWHDERVKRRASAADAPSSREPAAARRPRH